MGIFDFFSSKKNYAEMQSEEKLAHLKVLIALALSDGNLDDEEFEDEFFDDDLDNSFIA